MECPHLYLIADVYRQFVKVGVSADPNQRLRQLSSGQAPFPLMLLRSWPLENAHDCKNYLTGHSLVRTTFTGHGSDLKQRQTSTSGWMRVLPKEPALFWYAHRVAKSSYLNRAKSCSD